MWRRVSSPILKNVGWGLLTGTVAGVLLVVLLTGGCYDNRRADPVDRYHYDHFIAVSKDHTFASIQTYINRTPLEVGYRREDLYDGDKDGELETTGMDRVIVTDFLNVEDTSDKAVRRRGELRDYDPLFQRIINAAKAGKDRMQIEDRVYQIRILSENLTSAGMQTLG